MIVCVCEAYDCGSEITSGYTEPPKVHRHRHTEGKTTERERKKKKTKRKKRKEGEENSKISMYRDLYGLVLGFYRCMYVYMCVCVCIGVVCSG